MKVDLISKTNAITVLSTFFPEENWHDLIEDHLDVSNAEGMELLLKEDLIEFVVINTHLFNGDAEMRRWFECWVA